MEFAASHITRLLLFSLVVLGGCKTTQSLPVQPVSKAETLGMLFLSFSIKQDSVQGSLVSLLSKNMIADKLKSKIPDSNFEDRLIVKQLSKELKELSAVEIDHPLFRRVEFADDQGKLHRRAVELSEAEFFLRVEHQPETEIILVEEIIGNIKKRSTTFKIKD